ncbi:hypothetical protein COLO4_28492 [Corchorus olitorius]|uniref:Uncharacterized protein n=1 Tax=Corchorus olitorius TaxID=93759 RepID=A0A1R3HKF2_9ROSI|nr:hypothetical protein COLO4_28492 [Corchorus olitorius]
MTTVAGLFWFPQSVKFGGRPRGRWSGACFGLLPRQMEFELRERSGRHSSVVDMEIMFLSN